MRRYADETVVLLGLARELRKAMALARRQKPDVAMRLSVRFEAVLCRIRDLQAGRRPHPWPCKASQDRRVGALSRIGPFGCNRFEIARNAGIDFRTLCAAQIGR